jgi:hypothetical protein
MRLSDELRDLNRLVKIDKKTYFVSQRVIRLIIYPSWENCVVVCLDCVPIILLVIMSIVVKMLSGL